MDQEAIVDDLIETIKFDLDEIAEDDALDSIGGLCESVQNDYRALAILQLTSEMDVKSYCQNLVRSGYVRYYYLKRCANEGYDANPRIMSSRNEPFLNAVAANELELAKDIALLTSDYWWEEDEYEDDFYYSHFLHTFILFDENKKGYLQTLIDSYEKSLSGNIGARLEIMQGLLNNNFDQFRDAFERLIDERTSELEIEKDTGLSVDIHWQMDSIIFIEGLALLNMAMHIGFDMKDEYLYCPNVVRGINNIQLPKDGFPKIK